ncbi:hypothetical protein ChUKH1_00140 [Cryptosporidium hominis]|uniref:Uncharacterized protein n=1 Tax=Cryptosporidium hominis TaxID=237895 RepID=A0ABX5BI10_CRYHO|nr:hypothetical protein [Cryptosporidium hominis TU502]OLQ16517.1 hypothetical protein ChTU502y2012_382g0260 [Cryptosporidium hominis]PPA65529.1 hypothetical protein ChUKH1_00140 [Cryptosporidium hominis]PPS97398.1 Uncharacterized protein GY17_00000526 [Cryptosporidium hominis]|eukprot:PPS97398.1 Uncharacterized protein GY17_00000526 [Cryptosporidium hominis]
MDNSGKEEYPAFSSEFDGFLKELDLALKQTVKEHEKEITKTRVDQKVNDYNASIEFILNKAKKILDSIES